MKKIIASPFQIPHGNRKKGRLMGAEKLNRTHKNATKPDMQFLEFKLEFLELVLQFQELEQYSVLQGKRLV